MRQPGTHQVWLVAGIALGAWGCNCESAPTTCGTEGGACCDSDPTCGAGLVCGVEGDSPICRAPRVDAGGGDAGTDGGSDAGTDAGRHEDDGGRDAGGAPDAGRDGGPSLSRLIDFDTLPDGSPLAAGTALSDQYASVGATFSSSGAPAYVLSTDEAASAPNFLVGSGGNSFAPLTLTLRDPVAAVSLTLISVGDGAARVTAYDTGGAALDSTTVTHPGTGAGIGAHDEVTVRGVDIMRVEIAWTPTPEDGFGIDDVRL